MTRPAAATHAPPPPPPAVDGSEGRALPVRLLAVLGGLAVLAGIASLALRALGDRRGLWILVATIAPISVVVAGLAAMQRDRAAVQQVEARLRRFFTPPRRLKLTREGRYFVGITLGVGFAAINTGNNLLYLLLGMMLSLIIASGILSEMSLRGLAVSRQPPLRLHAGAPTLVGVALRNDKRRLPSFSIEVEDLIDGEPIDKRCWFLKVPAGRSQKTAYRHQFARRGRYRFTGFRLSTKFPFALFRKSRLVEDPVEVVVYPAVFAIDRPPPPLRGFAGDESRGIRSRRGEFYGLREYREGDDRRDVHWRSTARRGRLLVREHEEEEARRVTLFVDNALPGGAACDQLLLHQGLEKAVSLAASLAVHYLGRGYAVRLVARGESMPWITNASHADAALRALALLPTVTDDVPFAAGPEPGVETLYVARRGAPRPRPEYGRVLDAG